MIIRSSPTGCRFHFFFASLMSILHFVLTVKNSNTKTSTKVKEPFYSEQECIRVACIPSAAAAGGVWPGGYLPRGCLLGGVCPGGVCLGVNAHGVSAQGYLPRGVCPGSVCSRVWAQGMSAWGMFFQGCLPRGGVCWKCAPVHAGICTPFPPWTEFMTHAFENITFPQLCCGR